MKRFLILLTLPILACGGLAESVYPTLTPPAPPTVIPATQAESQPTFDPTPQAPVATEIVNASTFPNSSDYEWNLIASGLARPVDIKSADDGSGRIFIIEKYGTIRIFENEQLLASPFLDISDRVNDSGNEMGLLGLAFHPDYEQNGFFYVNYTGAGGNTFISRFHAADNIADPSSEKILLTVNQPFSNHKGGALAFGQGGYLYIGLGDGGSGGDPFGNGQNLNTLLGKILRIDVNNGDPYAIPADNPFVNTAASPEIWGYGLRNPWRFSFDRVTGDLYIGDVGQNAWEEIDFVPRGQGGLNFGWNYIEGNHAFSGNPPASDQLTYPVAEYNHALGCSITGGYVYRGAMPEWNGIYLYGDYCFGTIWGLILSNGEWQNQVTFETGVTITSFGQDESGEMYFSSDNGNIYRLTRK
ncbi:MAG: PQQ-dependent sugar dehydrogenase [Chloroflexi bacterium]|nr:PQQ-dependent sugar dehydrogenase [Chloroflexota bacterium]